MQLKKTILVAFFILSALVPSIVWGQITSTIGSKATLNSQSNESIPELLLPPPEAITQERVKATKQISRYKNVQYALPIEVHKDFLALASIQTEDSETIRRLRITSPGAYSLGIWFESFYLTPGSSVNIYNTDRKLLLGPLTNENNKPFGALMLQSLPTDELIIEYRTCNQENIDVLNIGRVFYDFRNLPELMREKSTLGYGTSGFCNVDINCPEGDDWQLTKKSVCKITYNGWLCSGTLVNNVKEDGEPYLLTANHCISSEFDANSAVFYFNYENEFCGGTEEPLPQTISGASLVATAPEQKLDFSLLKLSATPPPHYDVYYAGWNADSTTASNGASIHHPDGDVKKISISRYEPVTGNYGSGYDDDSHWQITEWSSGTTEGGSSGSPLFDADHRVIGDLTGGDASCNYNYNDFYSKLNLSWDAYPEPENQLKTWLNNWNLPVRKWDGLVPYNNTPGHLKTFTNQDTIVNLQWFPAKDTVAFKHFYIYRNRELIDSTQATSYIDSFALQNSSNQYIVGQIFTKASDKDTLFSLGALSRPMFPIPDTLHEAFVNNNLLPDNWYQESSADTVTWKFITGGGTMGPTTPYFGSYNAAFTDTSEKGYARLISPKIDLSGQEYAYLKFYYVLPENKDSKHSLTVLYRLHDSLPWLPLKEIQQTSLEWKRERIGLPELSKNLEIAFEATSTPYAPGVFIDSIGIYPDQQFVSPSLSTSKATACIDENIVFSTAYNGELTVEWDFGNEASPQTAVGTGPHEVSYSTAGRKTVAIQVGDKYTRNVEGAVQIGAYPEEPTFTIVDQTLTTELEFAIQWHLDGLPIENATSSNYSIKETGYYKLSYTNAYGCTSFSPKTYVVYTNINDTQEHDNPFSLRPNPAQGYVEIILPGDNTSGTFELFDITGQKVMQRKLQQKSEVIPLAFPTGTYLVRIQTGTQIFRSKLLISR
jgi:hypothetical protein